MAKSNFISAAVLAAYFIASPAQADIDMQMYFKDGAFLFDFCKHPLNVGELNGFVCVNYVAGVSDGLAASAEKGNHPLSHCMPDTITANQLGRVVAKYVQDNPSRLHYAAVGVVTLALIEAWPCKDGAK